MSTRVQLLFDLAGQVALVTGGSRGLGLQIAEALGDAGATVVLVSRKAEDLEKASRGLAERGIRASWIAGDVADADQIAEIGQETLGRFGRLDILVNNAGATWGSGAEDYPLEAWDKVMNLNLRSVFLMSQYIARHSMIPRRQGRILMIASIAALSGMASGREAVAYYASKGGLANLTRALAAEWGEHGITVNAIAPGWFPSKMSRGTIDAVGIETMAAQTPLGRLGGDDDLKGAAVLFASRASQYITGQVLAVDGGYSAVGR
jgi:NAD(P)-dependent dehydrogenase (short-subunit alcohol dehydrogenase family)